MALTCGGGGGVGGSEDAGACIEAFFFLLGFLLVLGRFGAAAAGLWLREKLAPLAAALAAWASRLRALFFFFESRFRAFLYSFLRRAIFSGESSPASAAWVTDTSSLSLESSKLDGM